MRNVSVSDSVHPLNQVQVYQLYEYKHLFYYVQAFLTSRILDGRSLHAPRSAVSFRKSYPTITHYTLAWNGPMVILVSTNTYTCELLGLSVQVECMMYSEWAGGVDLVLQEDLKNIMNCISNRWSIYCTAVGRRRSIPHQHHLIWLDKTTFFLLLPFWYDGDELGGLCALVIFVQSAQLWCYKILPCHRATPPGHSNMVHEPSQPVVWSVRSTFRIKMSLTQTLPLFFSSSFFFSLMVKPQTCLNCCTLFDATVPDVNAFILDVHNL